MPLKKYNSDQLKEINKYVKHVKSISPTINEEDIRHEWIEKNSQSFRERYGTAQLI